MARAPTPRRYAKATFQIALENGKLDGWLEELRAAQVVLFGEAVKDYLALPRVHLEGKVRAIREVLVEVDLLLQNLVCLLASRGSLEMVPAIVQEYGRLLDSHHGRARAQVATAVPLDDSQESLIKEQLRKLIGMKVTLSTRVDPEVVGGLVARVGDKVIDGSTRRALGDLKQALAQEVPA